ncbi:MAG TPA: hypothetical protein VGK99_06435 [Acidobacteriota bacterium]
MKRSSTYQEIKKSLREVKKKLQELQESGADPNLIQFISAHLRWIEHEIAAHKAEFESETVKNKSLPDKKPTP